MSTHISTTEATARVLELINSPFVGEIDPEEPALTLQRLDNHKASLSRGEDVLRRIAWDMWMSGVGRAYIYELSHLDTKTCEQVMHVLNRRFA